jgi:hypothetical protein
MTPNEAEQVARLLEQLHDGTKFIVDAFLGDQNRSVEDVVTATAARNPLGGIVLSFAAVAIIYSVDCVARELNWPRELLDVVDTNALGVQQNDQANGESTAHSCLRHLRNVFAHGRYVTQVVPPDVVRITMTDERNNHPTFQAECEVQTVVDLAERLLVAAHRLAAGLAPPAQVPHL